MNDRNIEAIKQCLGITTDDEEVTNSIKIRAKATEIYLKKAGMKIDAIDGLYSEEVIACISIGVNDLLNNKAGDTKFSPAFKMIAMQICRG